MMYRTCTVQIQPRLLLRSRHGAEDAGRAGAAAGRAPRCSPTRRSPKASPTASCRSAPRSGATPTTRAPACCRSCSSRAWASSATPIMRSTCRCISSSAATATSTSRANRSAIISPASSFRASSATISDWANHVSTIFPEVRLKRYIEMRGSDGGPWRRLPSLPAFWVGLIYDDANLDACWEIVKDWTAEERQKLRDDVPKLGFKAAIRGRSLLDLAGETLALAEAGSGPPQDASTTTAATRRAICGRCRRSRRAASRRPRSCWQNTAGRGTARSSRSSTNTRIRA